MRMRPERALLGEFIGEGSFGVVYSGTYAITKGAPPLPVAFKRIKLSMSRVPPEVVKCLTREVKAMQRLSHPNLLRLYAVCDDLGARDSRGSEIGLCLCLEHCERGSLSDLLKDPEVDLPWTVRACRLSACCC